MIARLLFALVVALGFVLGAAAPTIAHTVSSGAYAYWSSNANCTWVKSYLEHTKASLDVDSKRALTVASTVIDCGGWLNVAANGMRAKTTYITRNPDGSWGLCADSPWTYNAGTANHLGVNTFFPGGNPAMCGGPRDYRADAHGYVMVNGTWYGGVVSSPVHIFP